MCIAIMNKSGVTLKRKTLRNCWENNGDGAGMLWVQNGELHVYKQMNSFDKFYQKYRDIRKEASKSHIVLHFRIATHGVVDESNCHPFLVSAQLGFVHNGVIYDMGYDKQKSDTHLFAELLRGLPSGWEYNASIIRLIDSLIGSTNKLLFLDSENNYMLFNEDKGVWDMGCWFSNTTYKDRGYKDFGGVKWYDKKPTSTIGKSYALDSSFGSAKTHYKSAEVYKGRYFDSNFDESKSYFDRQEEAVKEYEDMSLEQKKNYGYVSDECDYCMKQVQSEYHIESMAYICPTCKDEWLVL